jgi:hypothetical protein
MRRKLGFLLLWTVLLGLVLILPSVLESPSLANDLTRNTVRLALVYYAVAVTLMLSLSKSAWASSANRVSWARWSWTLAWLTFLVHLYVAFRYYHHGSHEAAVRHTEEVSGFGPGIYFSHLFTVLWTADVVYWWPCPERYARRSPWIDRLLHGYMFFIVFNSMVVFETGLIRWAGLLLTIELAALMICRISRSERLSAVAP